MTNFEYDTLNRLTKHIFPGGDFYKYTYDEGNNVLQKLTPNTDTIIQTFDELGRLVTKNMGALGTWTYDYDNNSNLIEAKNSNAEVDYQYNQRNEVDQIEVQYPGLFSGTKTLTLTYDDDSNIDTVTTYAGEILDYNFDALNRLTQLEGHNGRTAVNTYDVASRLTAKNIKASVGTSSYLTCNYAYDDLNRLLQMTDAVITCQYNYDAFGNRLFENTSYPAISPNTTLDVYQYDDLYRVTGTKYGVTHTLTSGTINDTNQPTAPDYATATGADNVQATTFDKVHNRTAKTETNTQGGTSNIAYTANARNQYTAVNETGANPANTSPTWDSNGNLTDDGERAYEYDFENRILKVKDDLGATIVDYKYDAQGRRIAKVFPGGDENIYLWDHNWNLCEERDENDNLLREFSYTGQDQLLTATFHLDDLGIDPVDLGYTAGTTSIDVIYHQNSIGNVLALSDESGAPLLRYSYDIHGAVNYLNASGTVILTSHNLTDGTVLNAQQQAFADLNVSLYQGRDLDAETGLYYFRNRYYHPEMGRFVTHDPLDYVDSMNLYAFVNGNVVNVIDPLGLAGYFFDGTNNDMQRDIKDTKGKHAPTHVAAIRAMYNEEGKKRFYQHGVGTRTDKILGKVAGKGAKQRIDAMFADFKETYRGGKGDTDIDIFGFSRGAAMAREFSNRIKDAYPDAKIRFMGVFDTVAQTGTPDPFNINPGIRLDIPDNVEYTAHAVAKDEFRKAFPLTSVAEGVYDEKNLGVLPKKYSSQDYVEVKGKDFWEKPFDGAHSDIGGGYVDGTNTNALEWMIKTAQDKGVPLNKNNPEFKEIESKYKNKYETDKKWHNSRWINDKLFNRQKRRIFEGNKKTEVKRDEPKKKKKKKK